ncbi:DNA recombination protein [Metamycoplasma auris 15026]|uniref:DNA recombination protein n=1 Tax=Metamycoplasma auris 15026 TaxID=1188233 RepID=N9UZY5_9BACT|nr:DNA recombination protein RmuC [Metamycoplasma auris]ENY68712.1 DNA recombination protein [Metamycoplasma auris 15026]
MVIGILIVSIITLIVLIGLLIYVALKSKGKNNIDNNELKNYSKSISDDVSKEIKSELHKTLLEAISGTSDISLSNIIKKGQIDLNDAFIRLEAEINGKIDTKLDAISKSNDEKFGKIKDNIDSYFKDTLDKQVETQFQNIKESMDKMTKGMTEFGTIQESVTNLNKLFSNSKTIGNFGEFNLEQILRNQFPALENKYWFKQYKIDLNKDEKIDFAIKSIYLEDGVQKEIYIPIDCKFPAEKWAKYINSEIKYNEVIDEIKKMAKSISEKYIKENKNIVPFGILYLPSESIYLKMIENFEMVSEIFNKHQILIQGPSTIMAFIYNILIKNQGFMFSKHLEDVKNLFIEIQKNYKLLNDHLVESQKGVNKASDAIRIATKNANIVMNKINANAESLHIEKVEYKKLIEKNSDTELYE